MEIIKDFVAVICITAMIINDIMCFYGFIFGRDKKEKLTMGMALIMQIMTLYGCYRIISFFNS